MIGGRGIDAGVQVYEESETQLIVMSIEKHNIVNKPIENYRFEL